MVAKPCRQVVNELHRGVGGTLADEVAGNQLRLGIESNERVLIADLGPLVRLVNVLVLLRYKGPDFINLDALARQIHKSLAAEPSSRFADSHHEAKNGVTM